MSITTQSLPTTPTTKETWRSKLGMDYDKAFIETYNKVEVKQELDRLRRQVPGNQNCAECGGGHVVWASVNLGVFLCIQCGSHHRSIGTHISKPKGCTGTYLWGPDEIERMRSMGNARAAQVYGGVNERPNSRTASDAMWKKYLVDKYQHQRFITPQQQQQQQGPILHDESSSPFTTTTTRFGSATATITTTTTTTKEANKLVSEQDFFEEFGL